MKGRGTARRPAGLEWREGGEGFDSIQGDFSLVFRVGCALAKANVISLVICPFLHSVVFG